MGKFNKSLSNHQQWVADNKTPLVIARWGRQTGKDTVAKQVLRKGDVVVFVDKRMADIHKDEFRSGVQLLTEHEVLSFGCEQPEKRVFLSEFAIFQEPIHVLAWADRAKQIYLVSTPYNALWRGVNVFDALGYWMRGTEQFNHAPSPPEVMKSLKSWPKSMQEQESKAKFPKENHDS